MFSNEDNSNIETNVNKGDNGTSEKTVSIGIGEYKAILELAYKAAMLKEAVLDTATLDIYGNDLYFSCNHEIAVIFKYAFPAEYRSKIHELTHKKKAEKAEQTEPTTIVKEDVEE